MGAGTKVGKEESHVVVLEEEADDDDEIPADLKWAFRVLAPFGLSEGQLLVNPPASQEPDALKLIH